MNLSEARLSWLCCSAWSPRHLLFVTYKMFITARLVAQHTQGIEGSSHYHESMIPAWLGGVLALSAQNRSSHLVLISC